MTSSWCRGCSNEKKLRYRELEGTVSTNETEYQSAATTTLEENEDVLVTIHTAMESVG